VKRAKFSAVGCLLLGVQQKEFHERVRRQVTHSATRRPQTIMFDSLSAFSDSGPGFESAGRGGKHKTFYIKAVGRLRFCGRSIVT